MAALTSLSEQTLAPQEVVLVVDHSTELLERARRELGPKVTVLANAESPGLSGARNTGLLHSRAAIVAFLDDAAVADPTWLERIAVHYMDPRVLGVGGAVVPDWLAPPPRWLPSEFYWVVGCSYTGLPRHAAPIRNFIGANMSFRRSVFAVVGGFTVGIGRVGTRPLGCEETELCTPMACWCTTRPSRFGTRFPRRGPVGRTSGHVASPKACQRPRWQGESEPTAGCLRSGTT